MNSIEKTATVLTEIDGDPTNHAARKKFFLGAPITENNVRSFVRAALPEMENDFPFIRFDLITELWRSET